MQNNASRQALRLTLLFQLTYAMLAMKPIKSLIHKASHWLNDTVWKLVDPQEQFLGIQLDITNACNLSCAHCYHSHHKNVGALTFEQWKIVLNQYELLLKKLWMKPRITLCGGEPLVCPFLSLLLEDIRKRFPHCQILLLSNGTLVTNEIAHTLKRNNVHVQISMDGPDAERHDMVRGPNAFGKTLKGCIVLRDAGVEFHHLAVLSHRTAQWIGAFFDLPKLTGAQEMHFVRLVAEGAALKMLNKGDDAPLEGNDLKIAYQNILKHSHLSGTSTTTRGALWHLIDSSLGSPNNIGMSGFVIGYRGEFKVSSRVSATLGNVLQDSMEDLFLRHPVMKQLRMGKIETCGDCKYYKKCRGDRNVSYATHGHFLGPDPGCWLSIEQTGIAV